MLTFLPFSVYWKRGTLVLVLAQIHDKSLEVQKRANAAFKGRLDLLQSIACKKYNVYMYTGSQSKRRHLIVLFIYNIVQFDL
jgi:hypothetical protein